MRRTTLALFLLLVAGIAQSQTPSPKDIDIQAPDSTKLRATFFPAAQPGPGVLLLYMCNTARKSCCFRVLDAGEPARRRHESCGRFS